MAGKLAGKRIELHSYPQKHRYEILRIMKSFLPAALVLIFSCAAASLHSQSIACKWQHPQKQQGFYKQAVHGNPILHNPSSSFQRTADADSLYTLPVVVHVIHTGTAVGAADNPADADINAMLSTLNNAWRKSGALYGGVNIKIQFQLAVRSPACGSTTGINRVDGSSLANYVSGGLGINNYPGSADQRIVKALSRWSNTDYINIWIVNKINGNANAGGFAYFAEYNEAAIDGIVLCASAVNAADKAIVHEMGHVFELYHTFYDDAYETQCPRADSCASFGDLVCDTEPCKVEYLCSNTTNSCTGNPYLVADATHNYTVLNNYMNYTDCPWMFTQQQKERIRATLFSFRPGLITSLALTAPSGALPAAACAPAATYGLSFYYGVQRVQFNTLNVYSNSSNADGSRYVDRTCNQSTWVIKGQSYLLTVTGSYYNPHRIKAFIDYNNDGDFDDPGETVLSDLQGEAAAMVSIPLNGVKTKTPLRMRIIADNPALPEPAACQLHGTSAEGAGQAEDYAVIIFPRKIVSASSGAWNAAATWSCNCVPQADDEVTIHAPHAITLTPAMGAQQCGALLLETGATFNVSGSLKTLLSN